MMSVSLFPVLVFVLNVNLSFVVMIWRLLIGWCVFLQNQAHAQITFICNADFTIIF